MPENMVIIDEIMELIKPCLEKDFTNRLKAYIKTAIPQGLKDEDKMKIREEAKNQFADTLLEVAVAIEAEMDVAQDNMERNIEIEFWDDVKTGIRLEPTWQNSELKMCVYCGSDLEEDEICQCTKPVDKPDIWSTQSEPTCGCDYEPVVDVDDLKEEPGVRTHNADFSWDEIEFTEV